MRVLSRLFVKGLVVVLPITLTVYILYWLGAMVESAVKAGIRDVIGVQYYFPGLGILGGLVTIVLVGVVAEAWIVKWLFSAGESLVLRIPLVKTIYGGLKDFMEFVSTASREKSVGHTVMAAIGDDVRMMGLVTRKDFSALPNGIGDEDTVGVYLPMSYQLGGFTVYIPRNKIQPIDMSPNDAMSFTLTAGISSGEENTKKHAPSAKAEEDSTPVVPTQRRPRKGKPK